MAVFLILLGALACAVSSLAAGLSLVRVLGLRLNRAECVCLGYCLGAAVVSLLTLGLAWAGLAFEGVFLALGFVALVTLWRLYPWLRGKDAAPLRNISVFNRVLFGAAWLVFGVFYFRYALAPEWSPDGISYHLAFVHLWIEAHRMFRVEDMYAALPAGIEMLYLFAFSIGRHSAAALVHFSLLMMLPWLMVLYGVRFGLEKSAVFAAVIVFVTPLVGWGGSIAYNDVALAVVAFAAIYLTQLWRVEKQSPSLVAASLLAGFAVAIKYTGCFVFPVVAGSVVWELRWQGVQRLAKTVLVVVAVAAIGPAPYLLRNWLWFENPVAFFGNSVFKNPYFTAEFEKDYIDGQVHLHGIEWRELPRELTLGGPKLPEALGPMYLLAPVALLGLFWGPSRYLVISALVLVCPYPGNKSARFLIPVLPPLMLALGSVLSRLRAPSGVMVTGGLTVVQVVICWPTLTTKFHSAEYPGLRFQQVHWREALRQVPEERFLMGRTPEYEMSLAVDQHVPKGQTVYCMWGGVAQSYTSHVMVSGYRSARADRYRRMLDAAVDERVDVRKAAMQSVKRDGIEYIVISADAPFAPKFRDVPVEWGLREVVKTKNATLYSIE